MARELRQALQDEEMKEKRRAVSKLFTYLLIIYYLFNYNKLIGSIKRDKKPKFKIFKRNEKTTSRRKRKSKSLFKNSPTR